MKILSHRGYWKSESEKNTKKALDRSVSNGFGFETDIRDYNGKLVISHDIASSQSLGFNEFLENSINNLIQEKLTLALNIKSDGLSNKLYDSLKEYPSLDVFVFDMSIPDMRSYFNAGIPVFCRMSEVEQPVWLNDSDGVWLDDFYSEWYDSKFVEELLSEGKRICLISPELHGRKHLTFWKEIKKLYQYESILLCTDFPEDAKNYFEGC